MHFTHHLQFGADTNSPCKLEAPSCLFFHPPSQQLLVYDSQSLHRLQYLGARLPLLLDDACEGRLPGDICSLVASYAIDLTTAPFELCSKEDVSGFSVRNVLQLTRAIAVSPCGTYTALAGEGLCVKHRKSDSVLLPREGGCDARRKSMWLEQLNIRGMAFCPLGRLFVCEPQLVRVFQLISANSFAELNRFSISTRQLPDPTRDFHFRCIAIAGDGTVYVGDARQRCVYVFDAEGVLLRIFQHREVGMVSSMALSPDDQWLALSFVSCAAILLFHRSSPANLSDPARRNKLHCTFEPSQLCFLADGALCMLDQGKSQLVVHY